MLESLIQNAIETYLKLLENQGKLVYQKNNSGALQTRAGGFVRFGKRGAPDFLVFIKAGKTLHLECKNEKGRQNANQLEFEINITNLGHKYFIVRSVSDVENILKKYL